MDWEKEEGLYLGLEEKEKQGWLYYNSLNLSANYLVISVYAVSFLNKISIYLL